MGKEHRILIDYTNHADVRQVREIEPQRILFASTQWHPEAQWLLDAYDVGKDDLRTFAMKDIHRWGVEPGRQMEIDLSIAAQLQRSMELNARMKNRLIALAGQLDKEANPEIRDVGDDLLLISKDEDPT